ncbi:hypothetical protein A2U01_0048963, partial [Trifolium medium]|nr:hypothetical protein [Trifolium medium]
AILIPSATVSRSVSEFIGGRSEVCGGGTKFRGSNIEGSISSMGSDKGWFTGAVIGGV